MKLHTVISTASLVILAFSVLFKSYVFTFKTGAAAAENQKPQPIVSPADDGQPHQVQQPLVQVEPAAPNSAAVPPGQPPADSHVVPQPQIPQHQQYQQHQETASGDDSGHHVIKSKSEGEPLKDEVLHHHHQQQQQQQQGEGLVHLDEAGNVEVSHGLPNPINEGDLPDDEYRKLHRETHLFNEHVPTQIHDEDPQYGMPDLQHHKRAVDKEHEGEYDYDDDSDDYDDNDDDDDDEVEDRDDITAAWSEHMDDFIPDMLVTFNLPARSDEYFYQVVGESPTLIRGGYFMSGSSSSSSNETSSHVQFSILDPTGEVEYKKRKSEGLFHFASKKPGVYTFVLSNSNWVGSKFATFVVGTGNETTLSIDHVNSVNQNVMMVARMVQDVHSESQYLWARQKNDMEIVQLTHWRTYWVSVLELFVILVMTILQMYLLRGLVSHKRFF